MTSFQRDVSVHTFCDFRMICRNALKISKLKYSYRLFGTIFLSFEAEHYGERIVKIGQKLSKLWLFKASKYMESRHLHTWKQPLSGNS